jgi:hypothetical protein
MSDDNENRAPAEATFKAAKPGTAAITEHHAAAAAVRDKTARLRAQRLAKEATDDGVSRSGRPLNPPGNSAD